MGSTSLLCLLLLVCINRDGAVRVQHHLSTTHYGHQQEEAEEEEEEEGKTKIHIHIQPGNGKHRQVHVDKSTKPKKRCSSTPQLVFDLFISLLMVYNTKVWTFVIINH